MAKKLIMTIHVNLVLSPSDTWRRIQVVIKIFAIKLWSHAFLGHHLCFHIFFILAFGDAHIFTAWLFLHKYHFVCNCIFILHQSLLMACFMVVFICLVRYYRNDTNLFHCIHLIRCCITLWAWTYKVTFS